MISEAFAFVIVAAKFIVPFVVLLAFAGVIPEITGALHTSRIMLYAKTAAPHELETLIKIALLPTASAAFEIEIVPVPASNVNGIDEPFRVTLMFDEAGTPVAPAESVIVLSCVVTEVGPFEYTVGSLHGGFGT